MYFVVDMTLIIYSALLISTLSYVSNTKSEVLQTLLLRAWMAITLFADKDSEQLQQDDGI